MQPYYLYNHQPMLQQQQQQQFIYDVSNNSSSLVAPPPPLPPPLPPLPHGQYVLIQNNMQGNQVWASGISLRGSNSQTNRDVESQVPTNCFNILPVFPPIPRGEQASSEAAKMDPLNVIFSLDYGQRLAIQQQLFQQRQSDPGVRPFSTEQGVPYVANMGILDAKFREVDRRIFRARYNGNKESLMLPPVQITVEEMIIALQQSKLRQLNESNVAEVSSQQQLVHLSSMNQQSPVNSSQLQVNMPKEVHAVPSQQLQLDPLQLQKSLSYPFSSQQHPFQQIIAHTNTASSNRNEIASSSEEFTTTIQQQRQQQEQQGLQHPLAQQHSMPADIEANVPATCPRPATIISHETTTSSSLDNLNSDQYHKDIYGKPSSQTEKSDVSSCGASAWSTNIQKPLSDEPTAESRSSSNSNSNSPRSSPIRNSVVRYAISPSTSSEEKQKKRKRASHKGSFEFIEHRDVEIKEMIDKYHRKMDQKEQELGLLPYGSQAKESNCPKQLEIRNKKTRTSKPYDRYITTFQFK
jgi:hypothetical protein